MRLILKLTTILLCCLLGYSAAYSVNPSRSISIRDIEKRHPNITFKKIRTGDNYRLLIADIKPQKELSKNVAILVCYPDSGNIQRWLGYGVMLAEMGYNAVMFDYRGFGGSDPFTINRDTLYYDEYLTDAKTAFGYLFKTYPDYKLGVYGMSMGSIIATQLANQNTVDFIIGDSYVTDLDSTVTSIRRVFNRQIVLPESAYGYNDIFDGLQQPMLIFNGKYDTICASGDNTFMRNSLSQTVTYRGGYMEGPESLHNSYFTKIDEFIGSVIAREKQPTKNDAAGILVKIAALLLIMAGIPLFLRHRRRAGC